MRVRHRDDAAVLTVKRGGGLQRAETEVELSANQAERLWPLTEGRRIRKRRHRVKADGLTIEVDVYRDELDGLSVAEIEFPSRDASAGFEPPEWLGRELTGDERYTNERLAEDGMPERPP